MLPSSVSSYAAQTKRERNKLRHERNKQWRGYLQSLQSNLRDDGDGSGNYAGDAPAAVASGPRKMRNAKEVRASKVGLAAGQRCSFFLERKKRTCNRARMEGSCYCVTHQHSYPCALPD